jgi:hypothetical protein
MRVIDEPPVEIERDPSLRNIEGEFTEGAVIVFPAAVFLFEVAVAKLLDGFAKGDFVSGGFLASELETAAPCCASFSSNSCVDVMMCLFGLSDPHSRGRKMARPAAAIERSCHRILG